MIAPQTTTVPELTLPAFDVRAVARRLAPAALIAAAAVATLMLVGGHARAFTDALSRGIDARPGWGVLAVALEGLSVGGYIVLLSLVAGRAAPRVTFRASAQITLAGTAATRLLPTAGAGGAALTLWTLRRAGLETKAATRTLLAFLVLLYAVFLGALVVAGAALLLGLTGGHGPAALSAIPAAGALIGIAAALVLGLAAPERALGSSRIGRGAELLGGAVRDALSLVRSADPRLLGAPAYWLLDASVVWATLHAFGYAADPAVIVLSYFVGQVANTIPIPGSVTGGMTGVLIAFGVPAQIALPAVLTYRTVAIWLPSPLGLAALARLRSTIAGWASEDAQAS